MMLPSDHNFDFNVKVMADLKDLCTQLYKAGKEDG